MATPQIAQSTLDQLLLTSTATLTSVLRNHGLTNTFMHNVVPLKPDMKMVGIAFTLRYIPAREDLNAGEVDNLKDVQRVGIEQMVDGEVLVIDARGDTSAGTMGSILATRVFKRGGVGLVTDGAYRDSPAIAAIGLGAYAAGMNAHTNKTIHYPSEIQVPIGCGGVAVFPGDVVVGEITLLYQKGCYRPLEWTYPDYRSDDVQHFLMEIRAFLMVQRRQNLNVDV